MAISIPPPPTSAEQNSRVWTDWYIKLSQVLTSTAGVAWALVDKAGSKLSDLASRTHAMLTSINGTGDYHMSASEASYVTDFFNRNLLYLHSAPFDPVAANIGVTGAWLLWENTALGEIRIWAVNNIGVVKKSAAFT